MAAFTVNKVTRVTKSRHGANHSKQEEFNFEGAFYRACTKFSELELEQCANRDEDIFAQNLNLLREQKVRQESSVPELEVIEVRELVRKYKHLCKQFPSYIDLEFQLKSMEDLWGKYGFNTNPFSYYTFFMEEKEKEERFYEEVGVMVNRWVAGSYLYPIERILHNVNKWFDAPYEKRKALQYLGYGKEAKIRKLLISIYLKSGYNRNLRTFLKEGYDSYIEVFTERMEKKKKKKKIKTVNPQMWSTISRVGRWFKRAGTTVTDTLLSLARNLKEKIQQLMFDLMIAPANIVAALAIMIVLMILCKLASHAMQKVIIPAVLSLFSTDLKMIESSEVIELDVQDTIKTVEAQGDEHVHFFSPIFAFFKAFFGITADKKKVVMEFSQKISMINSLTTFVKTVMELLPAIFDRFWTFMTGGPFTEKAKFRAGVKSSLESLNKYAESFREGVFPQKDLCIELWNKWKALQVLSTSIGVDQDIRTNIVAFMNNNVTFINRIMGVAVGKFERKEPIGIFIIGGPGVGKSTFVNYMCGHLLYSCKKIKPDQSNYFYRKQENDFWDGYGRQPVVIYDDVFQKKDTESRTAVAAELIYAINTAAYHLHMSSIDSKSDNYFDSDFVVMTANVMNGSQKYLPTELGITEPGALYRRMHVKVMMKILHTEGDVKPEVLAKCKFHGKDVNDHFKECVMFQAIDDDGNLIGEDFEVSQLFKRIYNLYNRSKGVEQKINDLGDFANPEINQGEAPKSFVKKRNLNQMDGREIDEEEEKELVPLKKEEGPKPPSGIEVIKTLDVDELEEDEGISDSEDFKTAKDNDIDNKPREGWHEKMSLDFAQNIENYSDDMDPEQLKAMNNIICSNFKFTVPSDPKTMHISELKRHRARYKKEMCDDLLWDSEDFDYVFEVETLIFFEQYWIVEKKKGFSIKTVQPQMDGIFERVTKMMVKDEDQVPKVKPMVEVLEEELDIDSKTNGHFDVAREHGGISAKFNEWDFPTNLQSERAFRAVMQGTNILHVTGSSELIGEKVTVSTCSQCSNKDELMFNENGILQCKKHYSGLLSPCCVRKCARCKMYYPFVAGQTKEQGFGSLVCCKKLVNPISHNWAMTYTEKARQRVWSMLSPKYSYIYQTGPIGYYCSIMNLMRHITSDYALRGVVSHSHWLLACSVRIIKVDGKMVIFVSVPPPDEMEKRLKRYQGISVDLKEVVVKQWLESRKGETEMGIGSYTWFIMHDKVWRNATAGEVPQKNMTSHTRLGEEWTKEELAKMGESLPYSIFDEIRKHVHLIFGAAALLGLILIGIYLLVRRFWPSSIAPGDHAIVYAQSDPHGSQRKIDEKRGKRIIRTAKQVANVRSVSGQVYENTINKVGKIRNNVFSVFVYRGFSYVRTHLFFVNGLTAVTPAHTFINDYDYIEFNGDDLFGQPVKIKRSEVVCKIIDGRDLAVLKFADTTLMPLKDLRNHLLKRSDHRNFTGVARIHVEPEEIVTANRARFNQDVNAKLNLKGAENHVFNEYYEVDDMKGGDGFCGLPYVHDTRQPVRTIFGIHFAGYGMSSYVVPLYLEDFEDDKSPSLLEVNMEHLEIPLYVDENIQPPIVKGFRPIGTLNKVLFMSPKNPIVASPLQDGFKYEDKFYENIFPITKVPTKMKPGWKEGIKVDPLKNALERVAGRKLPVMPDMDFQMIHKCFKGVFHEKFDWSKVEELTLHEAINGVLDSDSIKAVDHKTSSSVGFAERQITSEMLFPLLEKDKQNSFGNLRGIHPQLKKWFDYEQAAALQDKYAPYLVQGTLKAELKTKGKEWKPRLFCNGSKVHLLRSRVSLARLFEMVRNHGGKGDSYIGIVPQSIQWTQLHRKMQSYGKDADASDTEAWDFHFRFWFASVFLEYVKKQKMWTDDTPQFKRMKAVLISNLSAFIILGNAVYQSYGMPSGSYATADFNSIFNSFLMRFCWYFVFPDHDFDLHIALAVFGDDVLQVIRDIFSYDGVKTAELTEELFGMKKTSILKDGSPIQPSIKLTMDKTWEPGTAQFLQRGFREENGISWPILNKESINSMLLWYDTTSLGIMTKEDLLIVNIETALREYAFYSQLEYDVMESYLLKYARSIRPSYVIPFTRNDIREAFVRS